MKDLHPDMRPTHKVALLYARRLGCTVVPVKASGEVRITAPDGRRMNVNNRRQEASRALLDLLLDVQRAARQGATPTNGATAPAEPRGAYWRKGYRG